MKLARIMPNQLKEALERMENTREMTFDELKELLTSESVNGFGVNVYDVFCHVVFTKNHIIFFNYDYEDEENDFQQYNDFLAIPINEIENIYYTEREHDERKVYIHPFAAIGLIEDYH